VDGFAAAMQQGLNGTTSNQIQAISNVFYLKMGLQKVSSGQRLYNNGAILAHMQVLAR